MAQSFNPKPLISAGWLRSLLYIVTLLLITVIAGSIYLIGFHKGSLELAAINELLKGDRLWMIVAVFFILTLIVTYVFRRWVDKKSFFSLGLDYSGHGPDAIAGAALGISIICISTLILKISGHLKWMDILFDPRALFTALGSIVIIAFYEELIFRGYILNNLLDSFPKWPALFISAVLFMIFHWTAVGFFPLANTLIMGMILGLNYIYSKNLWFSVCFHIGWKFFHGPLLGFSGDDSFQTLLQTDLNGDVNLTGGANGLEGSMILMIVSLLALIALFLIYQKKVNPQSPPVPGRI